MNENTLLLFAAMLIALHVSGCGAKTERNEHRPLYSPDGGRIVFMSMSEKTGGDWELYLMDAAGGNPRRLTNHEGWDGYAVWSPDGKRLVFDRELGGDRKQPHFLDLESASVSLPAEHEGWLSVSDFASSGYSLLGFHEVDKKRDLVLINLAGTAIEYLTRTPDKNEHDAHFVPDGRIVFAVEPAGGGGSTLETLLPITGEREVLHESKGRIYGLGVSPDGKTIAFTDAPGGDDDDADIYLLDTRSREVRALTDDPAWDHMPAWHPDGKSLLFTSYRSGEERIYTLDPATGAVAELTIGDWK